LSLTQKSGKKCRFAKVSPSKHGCQGRIIMNVLITGRIPDDVLALIKKEHKVEINLQDMPMDREKILSNIIDKDGILCMITDRIDKELLDKAQHLKIIANFGVGFNNIDVKAATERGIPVANTPGILTDATADMTFALILASGRRVVEGDKLIRAGKFKYWAPLLFLGHEVTGKTLLINTSRGPVVDETALLNVLKNKVIKGAGLDVYENEPELTPGLIDLDNVVLLPHMGSGTIEMRTKMALMATENLLSGLNGEIPPIV